MDDEQEKVRKTVSFTHKQLGATGLAALALALTPFLKEIFYTRNEAVQVSLELQFLRKDFVELKASVDSIPARVDTVMKESMKQVHRDVDRNEKRIENLEVYAFKTKRTNTF